MNKICSACNHIGKEIRSQYIYVVLPIFLIVFSIGVYRNSDLLDNYTFGLLAILTWLVFGIYTLVIFIDKPDSCPNCKRNQTMIPLDTPHAQQLIKENNISVPEEAQKDSSPQST